MRAMLTGLVFSLFAAIPAVGYAADQPEGTAPPPAATESLAPGATGPTLTAPQLDQLVAPIALYPDELLSDVLMASTYPIEIVEADRWLGENKSLTGTALTSALDQQSWHASVKSLVATPTVLNMMNDQLGWTQQLGNAVLAQQADVMAAVQRLRAQAQAEHKLESTKQQNVSVQTQNDKQVVVIEPAVPGTIYVPYYNPAIVYGAWPYPAYLPYYWPPPPGIVFAAGFGWGIGFYIGDPVWHGYWGGYWGGFDWWHGNIVIHQTVINNNNIHVNVNTWQHDVNDKPDNLASTYHGDPKSFDDDSKQAFMNDLHNTGGDTPGTLGDTDKGNGQMKDIGDQHDNGFGANDFHGDAFGGWGGARSDYGGGGFRGRDWGGGGGFRRRH